MKKKNMAFAAILAISGASLCHNAAFAQAGMTTATPPVGVTSSLGTDPSVPVGPNGLQLGVSPTLSPVPNGMTGTVTAPSTSSGAGACSTSATPPMGTFGSPATYDGGGMAMAAGTTMPATSISSGISTSTTIAATSGESTSSGMAQTSGLTGMCGSGSSSIAASSSPTSTSSTATSDVAQAGVPLDSTGISNLGVSAAQVVPLPNVSAITGSARSSSSVLTMPATGSTVP
jgi:hypothetical protein